MVVTGLHQSDRYNVHDHFVLYAKMSPTAGKATRSTSGCQTCKRRRKKCDEGRPKCQVCIKLGVECDGYTKNLVWGNGIASRGKFKGAVFPTLNPPVSYKYEPIRQIPTGVNDLEAVACDGNQSPESPRGHTSRDYPERPWPADFSQSVEQNATDDESMTWGNSPEEDALEKELSDRLIVDCEYSLV